MNNPEKYKEAKTRWICSCLKKDLKQYKKLIEYVVEVNPPDLPFRPRCHFPHVNLVFPTQIDKVKNNEFNFELGAFRNYYDDYYSTVNHISSRALVNMHSKYIYDSVQALEGIS